MILKFTMTINNIVMFLQVYICEILFWPLVVTTLVVVN